MDPADLFPWLAGGTVLFTIFMVVISVLCTVVPLAAIFGGIFWYIRRSSRNAQALNQAALSWLTTTGTVIKSRVEVSGGDHTSVTPRVIYQYEVNGTTYQAERIKAGDIHMRISTSRGAYDTVDHYPEGATVTVYYNPMNPAEAALER
jgi:hypothetical protein